MVKLSYGARKRLSTVAENAADSVDRETEHVRLADAAYEAVLEDEETARLVSALEETRTVADVADLNDEPDVSEPCFEAWRLIHDALDARVAKVSEEAVEEAREALCLTETEEVTA